MVARTATQIKFANILSPNNFLGDPRADGIRGREGVVASWVRAKSGAESFSSSLFGHAQGGAPGCGPQTAAIRDDGRAERWPSTTSADVREAILETV